MIIKIPEIFQDKNKPSIEMIPPRVLSEEYLQARDQAWEEMVEEGKRAGKNFWNGELYSFEGIRQDGMDNPTLILGKMTYADRLFKKRLNPQEIAMKFGTDHVLRHCVTGALILTADRQIVVGIKKSSVHLQEGIYGHVSGNLNADEMTITTFLDIYGFITKEMEEETAITVDPSRLFFYGISLFNSAASFDFVYRLPISSNDVDIISKDDEFQSFITLSPEEVLSSIHPSTSDFAYSKHFLLDAISLSECKH